MNLSDASISDFNNSKKKPTHFISKGDRKSDTYFRNTYHFLQQEILFLVATRQKHLISKVFDCNSSNSQSLCTNDVVTIPEWRRICWSRCCGGGWTGCHGRSDKSTAWSAARLTEEDPGTNATTLMEHFDLFVALLILKNYYFPLSSLSSWKSPGNWTQHQADFNGQFKEH